MPGLSTIGQIAIPVKDLARAVVFYRDTLGLRFLFQAPPGLAFFDAGGVRLMLGLPEQPGHAALSSVVYFTVDDIAAMHRQLADAGARFTSEPHLIARLSDHELWMAFFEDGEGNTLALMSEVRLATL